MAKLVGWFQISGVRNPDNGNYLPETDPSGNPVSGPGWVAYEKPNAQPGDVVIIYKLWTVLLSGTATNNTMIAGTLWDLLNPAGLTYWTSTLNLKSTVSRTDVESLLPHPGGLLTPTNTDNPSGDPDLLWRRATTQYQLPGPGNTINPQFIRQVLPDFGLRILFWTDSCCSVSNVTAHPVDPPVLIKPPITPSTSTPVPPGNPPTLVPTAGTIPDPNGATLDPTPGEPKPNTWGGATAKPATNPVTNVTPALNKGINPDPKEPTPTSYTAQVAVSRAFHRPGSGYVPRAGEIPQPTYYNVSNDNPLPWRNKTAGQDPYINSRAMPVSPRYLALKEGGQNPTTFSNRITWTPGMDEATLAALGLIGVTVSQGARAQIGGVTKTPAPQGRSEDNFIDVTPASQSTLPPAAGSTSTNPTRRHGNDPANPSQDVSVGGYGEVKQRQLSDVTKEGVYRIPQVGNSQKLSRGKRRGRLLAKKIKKQSEKGSTNFDSGGRLALPSTIRRSIDVSFAAQATMIGSAQQTLFDHKGPAIFDLMDVKDAPTTENIKDSSDEFTISPIIYHGGPAFTMIAMVIGNVSSQKNVVLNQTAFMYSDDGTQVYNLGSSGVMEFGKVNPVQPGMYVIGNPACLPGQGGLPNLIAGGQNWNFMTLVLTLVNLENQVISQQTINFLPALAGDTDVVAPNRLPSGLMRDLEFTQTSNFLYDGTYNRANVNPDNWFQSESSVIVERDTAITNTVSLVLKATVTSQGQNSPFRPLMELYDDSTLQAGSNGQAGFVSGNCNATPGWINPITSTALSAGGIHTACQGILGHGGAGGTSAYVVNQQGFITSGPYNSAVYGGTHHCYLHFRYTSANQADSNLITAGGNKYRVRVYNNGPTNNLNGYVLYTQGLKVSEASATLAVNSSNELDGTITTYHCAQVLKIRNENTGGEIERLSSWQDGTVVVGTGTATNARLTASPGDIIKIYAPGYDNLYNSGRVVAQFTVA